MFSLFITDLPGKKVTPLVRDLSCNLKQRSGIVLGTRVRLTIRAVKGARGWFGRPSVISIIDPSVWF